jgi:hypothetical protein
MPQASDEARALYAERFGDIGCEHAIAELERRGYRLTTRFDWSAPSGHEPTREEVFWMSFLMDEWDFGVLLTASPVSEPRA